MCRMNSLLTPSFLIVALMSLFVTGGQVKALVEKDPHRPACKNAHCRKIKSFVKAHYCGASPFANGPDDGCEIKAPQKPQADVEVIAAYKCEWNKSKQAPQCEQQGQPSAVVRGILIRELQRLGLPANEKGQTFITVWKSTLSGWSLAEADYSRSVGPDIELCQVIVIIDQSLHVIVLRKVPFQKTDADVPRVTQWSPIDIAHVEGDGREDIVLEGDAYENHWFEVVSVYDGSAQTVFSGLGFYL
jgi:hypothetical protein